MKIELEIKKFMEHWTGEVDTNEIFYRYNIDGNLVWFSQSSLCSEKKIFLKCPEMILYSLHHRSYHLKILHLFFSFGFVLFLFFSSFKCDTEKKASYA